MQFSYATRGWLTKDKNKFVRDLGEATTVLKFDIQSTLVISTSINSNNRLSRGENLVLV